MTVMMDSRLRQATMRKASRTHRSLSAVVTEALRLVLREDEIDLRAVRRRAKQPESSLAEVERALKRAGRV